MLENKQYVRETKNVALIKLIMSCDAMHMLGVIRIRKLILTTNIRKSKEDKIISFYEGDFFDIKINALSSERFEIKILTPIDKARINKISKHFYGDNPVYINLISEVGVKLDGEKDSKDDNVKKMKYFFKKDITSDDSQYMHFIGKEMLL